MYVELKDALHEWHIKSECIELNLAWLINCKLKFLLYVYYVNILHLPMYMN